MPLEGPNEGIQGSYGTGLAPIIPAVVETAGNVVSTVLTNKANKKENAAARAYNLQMYNLQNEYNLPANQMARLQAAGLNPNLIYGSGGAKTEAAHIPEASPVNYNAPHLELAGMISALQAMQQIKNMRSAGEGLDIDNRIKEQELLRQHLDNQINFGPYMLLRNGKDVTAKFELGKYDQTLNNSYKGQKTFYDILNSSNQAERTESEITLNRQKLDAMGLSMESQRQLNRLRKIEADQAEQLKPYNMNSNDPAWIRAMLNIYNAIGGRPLKEWRFHP